MLTNLTFAAIVITLSWLLLLGYYLYLSHQQPKLEQELEALQTLLARKEQAKKEQSAPPKKSNGASLNG